MSSKLTIELPQELSEQVEQYLARFAEQAPESTDWLNKKLAQQEFTRQLYRVWSGSEFIALNCIRRPDEFQELVDSGDLTIGYENITLYTRCDKALEVQGSDKAEREAILHRQLREFRRYEIIRIMWRDLSGLANMIETTRDMSRLADAVLRVTVNKLHEWGCENWGSPVGKQSGAEQNMSILALGKLGADELNVSSDIDLIFAYPEVGETQGSGKRLTNQEFFIRLAQKLIQALDNQTVDGQVFRVDMRLRPYGSSGALVFSFDALEEYYQNQGRDWERYAMIKSRVVGGDQQVATNLTSILRAFTYRRYTDFSAIQSLRDMKDMINLEVRRRGLEDDIKLGHGGIREIEFVAQAFQLIYGGRDIDFQSRRLQDILQLLDENDTLPDRGGNTLWQAYIFLRDLEHVLQTWRDQQTQRLPGDEQDRLRVAVMMGQASWQELSEILGRHRKAVKEIFDGLVAENQQDTSTTESGHGFTQLWRELTSAELHVELERLHYLDAELMAERVESLSNSHAVRAMQGDSRSRLDKLMPIVIDTCAMAENNAQTLSRVLTLVESIAQRSIYLVLLIENHDALQQLVKLCAASQWISQSLSRHPVLLDELLDARTLYAPPDRQQLSDELRQQMLRIPEQDLERQMEALRYFRLAHSLRVAACEVVGVLPLMKVSDYLTWLAEVILDEVLVLAWQQLSDKHGMPAGSNGEVPGFLIVGYGKLGGIELGHGSDLDLVFLHNADVNLMTSGERSISNESFFTRLGQRVIHILNTVTPGGILYEVDMRLRPSGNSGMLVSSLKAFSDYQLDQAWTWEHQALVRARTISGDGKLASEFNELRHEVLIGKRDVESLKSDVADMRRKMADHLGLDSVQKLAGKFHLKQDPGGIVDVEFMVQFAVLANASRFPNLTRWSDNIRILEMLSDCGILTSEENQQLIEAYIAYRTAGHRLHLQGEPNIVSVEDSDIHRRSVLAIWHKLIGESPVIRSE
jgi:glutamate-ammonia-ligase adenylyltransferase